VLNDPIELERRVVRSVRAFRDACGTLRSGNFDPRDLHSGISAPLDDKGAIGALLAEPDDALRALGEWLALLALEQLCFGGRVRVATRWHERRDECSTLWQVRTKLLATDQADLARQLAVELADRALPLQSDTMRALEERQEAHAHLLDALRKAPRATLVTAATAGSMAHAVDTGSMWQQVQGAPDETVHEVATHLIARTDDLAHELGARGEDTSGERAWWIGLRRSVGRDATEGWPARLNARWLRQTFSAARLGDGLLLDVDTLPRPIGAASFARALGQFGRALLAASRADTVPFTLHARPFSSRRSRAAALFASLLLSPAFLQQVLGLSGVRLERQRRTIAAAFLHSLRIDALRVAVAASMATSHSASREHFQLLGERVLGAAPPTALLGVVPAMRPGDGAALVGTLLAVKDHRTLRERFDQDWFRNPRTGEHLRRTMAAADDVGVLEGVSLIDQATEIAEILEGIVG